MVQPSPPAIGPAIPSYLPGHAVPVAVLAGGEAAAGVDPRVPGGGVLALLRTCLPDLGGAAHLSLPHPQGVVQGATEGGVRGETTAPQVLEGVSVLKRAIR